MRSFLQEARCTSGLCGCSYDIRLCFARAVGSVNKKLTFHGRDSNVCPMQVVRTLPRPRHGSCRQEGYRLLKALYEPDTANSAVEMSVFSLKETSLEIASRVGDNLPGVTTTRVHRHQHLDVVSVRPHVFTLEGLKVRGPVLGTVRVAPEAHRHGRERCSVSAPQE